MKDFKGIIYGLFEAGELPENFKPIYEDLISGEFVSTHIYEGMDEVEINESLSVSDVKIVKEKYGKGVSVTLNGVEYRYISDELDSDELYQKVVGLMKKAGPGVVTKYLNRHAIPYWNSKYGDMVNGKSVKDKSAEGEVTETTQASDIVTKVQTLTSKNEKKKKIFEEVGDPIEGHAYKFEDGVFIVDVIVDDKVYLIGPDDETYVETVKEFQEESPVDVTDEVEEV